MTPVSIVHPLGQRPRRASARVLARVLAPAVMATLVAVALLVGTARVAAQDAPPLLTDTVNDFAGVIDSGARQELDALIRRLQAASGDVLVVATVRTFKPYADLQSYAVKMFENGGKGIGARTADGGALIVLAVDDRQVRVEVGYGLEGFVTDGFAGETSRDTMVPFFRRNDYGGGVLAGANRVAARIAEGRGVALETTAVARPRPAMPGLRFSPGLIILIIWILFQVMRSGGGGGRGLSRGSRWSSGVGPFGGGSGWSGGGGGWGGSSGGFGGGFGGGRSGGGGGGASW